MTKHDEILIQQAHNKPWEDINEDEAETTEGKETLHRIIINKYHLEEYKCGIL